VYATAIIPLAGFALLCPPVEAELFASLQDESQI
jgi:hypothetical protein